MAKIQRKVLRFLAIAAALAAGGCSSHFSSDGSPELELDAIILESDAGDGGIEADSPVPVDSCIARGADACGTFNCGSVSDGCGGSVTCGPNYWRGPADDYPLTTGFCNAEFPYFWTCARTPGGLSPSLHCTPSVNSPGDWCCREAA